MFKTALIACVLMASSLSEAQISTSTAKAPVLQAKPTATQQPSAANQSGTEASPIIVEVARTPPTPEEAAQVQADRQDEAAARWWTIRLTGINALFALGLVFVGGLQVWVLIRQQKMMRAQNDLTKAILKNTQNTDRAWINLETLVIEPGDEGNRVIAIGLRNSGRTPARILDANVTIRSAERGADGVTLAYLADLPDTPEYDVSVFAPPAVLVAGETSRWRYGVSLTSPNTWGLMRMSPGDSGKLWIYGRVTYTDQFNPHRPHAYGFAREYDPVLSGRSKTFRFAHVNKPAYNYAD
jgi:hypothetical protein